MWASYEDLKKQFKKDKEELEKKREDAYEKTKLLREIGELELLDKLIKKYRCNEEV